jgi:hypothetical protein
MESNIPSEKEEWFKNFTMNIFSSLEEQAFSYITTAEHSIVKRKEVEEYMHLSINVASVIMAQAIRQFYFNVKGLSQQTIYDDILNDFEDNLKDHLATLMSK